MTKVANAAEARAQSQVYAFLAQAFADPDGTTLTRIRQALPATEAALTTIGGTDSRAALLALHREFDDLQDDDLLAAHHRVFGYGVSGDCPPYEGEYGHAHIFQKAQGLADNAGFIEAFGLAPAPGFADRLDHIAVELEFLHVLAAKEAYALAHDHGEEPLAILRAAMRNYFEHHLGRWAPAFTARLQSKAQDGPYAALARLLAAFIAEQARALDVTPAMANIAPFDPQTDDETADCSGCAAGTVFNPEMRGES
ncbi:MAG: molecular chaperone TorD family protein [Pseudorhodoplanes sp.]|nr:molecular chaperone TorD family protein [Pseudorhodoplanes sp.]